MGGNNINNPIGGNGGDGGQCRYITATEIECDTMNLWGGPRLHAILCIDPAMFENQLPSLMLFLSQLIDGAKAEGKGLDITLHIKGKDTPIKLLTVREGTIDDILAYLFDSSLGTIEGTELKSKKDAFSLKDLTELNAYERSVAYPGEHEVIFLFEPEKFS